MLGRTRWAIHEWAPTRYVRKPRFYPLDPAGGTVAFHAGSPSFYYARVLQLPTNRWSVYDCLRAPAANPTDCAAGGKLMVKYAERAWTSPVWYLP